MLTKSKYKIGLQCPTRLYYNNNKNLFDNQSVDNPFLEALADGGFQVGELAKFLFCQDPKGEGITIESKDRLSVLEETANKLLSDNCIIAEAGFEFNGCFVRVDILEKIGNRLNIYEVKSKSISSNESFFNSKGTSLNSAWDEYLLDIAFQHHVVQGALLDREFEIVPHLLLVNKEVQMKRDSLNQLFRIQKLNGNNKNVDVRATFNDVREDLDLIRSIDVSNEVQWIYEQRNDFKLFPDAGSFSNSILQLKTIEEQNEFQRSQPGPKCKSCSFYSKENVNRCGRTKCFSQHNWNSGQKEADALYSEPLITELWLGKGGSQLGKQVWEQNLPFIKELTSSDFVKENIDESEIGFTPGDRRRFQIELNQSEIKPFVFDAIAFSELSSEWKWPLNFIDFETNTSAIPYFSGMRPYQTIAFQFSHHILEKDGTVRHHNEWLSFEPSHFPNINFLRALKSSLEANDGTVFRYATHENTVLNHLKADVLRLTPPDAQDLINFIENITEEKIEKEKVSGDRNMVDLLEIVLKCYYSKYAKGSNSIKAILPAILNDCNWLKEKYANRNTYGSQGIIFSHNFERHTWITPESGWDPYKTLPPVFSDQEINQIVIAEDFEDLANGGAAMMAYSMLQFTEISDSERQALRSALLRYCELDTMAMVMIIEGLKYLKTNHHEGS